MKIKYNRLEFFIRGLDAGSYLETFFVSAVSSLLLVRAFLELTGFPNFGGARFHIAHMLWGGMFMMGALLVSLAFINKEAKQLASVLGGAGFGMFIDELGKFITRDNNYFYQPAVALIYVVFILLFLAIRHAEKYFPITEKVYAVNSLELAKEAIMDDLDPQEHKKLMEYIDLSGSGEPFNSDLRGIVSKLKKKRSFARGWWYNSRIWMKWIYDIMVKQKLFINSVISLAIAYFFAGVGLAVWNLGKGLSFFTIGGTLSSFLALWFALLGIKHLLEKRRLRAFEHFKKGVAVSIFLTQFFLYLNQQLWGTFILVLNLLAFMMLKYLIDQEAVNSNDI